MNDNSRRAFVSRLLSGAGAALALSALPDFAAAHEHAATQVNAGAREYTIIGFLGSPKRQGNRHELGWKYIGFENPGMFSPPFGYYDAELLSRKKESK